MLIEFSVENYLSFKDRMTLNMEASSASELLHSNTFMADKLHLVKSAAIYGANASGKSNLIKAMSFMRTLVLNSSKESQVGEPIFVEPFRLNTATRQEPSLFEIIFLHEGIRYRYGFQVNQNEIVSEWLFSTIKKAEKYLFTREGESCTISPQFQSRNVVMVLQELIRPNSLLLSLAAQLNRDVAVRLLNWFQSIHIISGLQDELYMARTVKMLEMNKQELIRFLQFFDLGFVDIIVRDRILAQIGLAPSKLEIFTVHQSFDQANQRTIDTQLNYEKTASEGTKKIVALAGLLLETLEKPSVLLFDEFDARLHPLLSRKIIELFNSSETNPKGAQLIFATHDTNLLSNQLLRRDQIWFTEKMPNGATDLYSLADFIVDGKKVRNDASYSKDYILGKYGAIPYIGDFRSVFGGGDE